VAEARGNGHTPCRVAQPMSIARRDNRMTKTVGDLLGNRVLVDRAVCTSRSNGTVTKPGAAP
jgi:hypothetical protein